MCIYYYTQNGSLNDFIIVCHQELPPGRIFRRLKLKASWFKRGIEGSIRQRR